MPILIADSGSTKCEWCVVDGEKHTSYFTQGMSPYFLTAEQMEHVIQTELLPQLKTKNFSAIWFYGTGNKDINNANKIKGLLQKIFKIKSVEVDIDLTGAAKALCGNDKGIACILGTGSNSCFYDGKKIAKNSPGLGFILGDEGSGAYLGKKLIQYYLYDILEKELKEKFEATYHEDADSILAHVYRNPLPNRYLAAFSYFLSENRGHYMIENIIEDGLNDFFSIHLDRYKESRKYPIHFTGSIAWYFRDIIENLCFDYDMTLGSILKNPMPGLIKFHAQ